MTVPAPVTSPIEQRPLASIESAPRNYRRHDLGRIIASLKAHGFRGAIILDRKTGRIVAGHGRVAALRAMRKAGEMPPTKIATHDDDWLVPCLVEDFRDAAAAEAYLVADNRAAESAGHDELALAAILKDLAAQGQIEGTGYDAGDVTRLLREIAKQEKGDDAMPDPTPATTKLGDLWILGEHRLLCGDAGDLAGVQRLMGSDLAGLIATDPPYGIAYNGSDGQKGSVRPKGSGKRAGWQEIESDDLQDEALQKFLEGAFVAAANAALQINAAWYLWHAHLTQGFFAASAAAAAADLILHRQIIWAKPTLVFGRGDYHWRHELCFYGWRRGHRPPFCGSRDQTTVWEVGYTDGRHDRHHPTQKPVELWERPILNHLGAGELLYDPFAGSGTAIIAAERTNRRARCIEIEPAYCDVIVARWEQLTGRKADRQTTT